MKKYLTIFVCLLSALFLLPAKNRIPLCLKRVSILILS